ncbi:MAG: hypothetical protein PHT03_04365 [Bacilli bacterium]|nr:hypothetical protein [Bacilli bacterium]MDD4389021.1 hypothetical protein [Bacilli bacterium]
MKNNKGAVLVITSILLSMITLLAILAFSLFYYNYIKIDRSYKRMRNRLDLETIAQEVFIQFTKNVAGGYNPDDVIIVYYDDREYEIIYNGDDIYEYAIEKEYSNITYRIQVKFKVNVISEEKKEYLILQWEIANA